MPISLFIAKLLGPMFLVLGAALLTRPEAFRALLREFIASAVLMYLAGFFGLLGGLAMLLTHNVWALDWRVLITLIGWTTLIRALVTIFSPQWIVSAGAWLIERKGAFAASAALDLVVGAILTYFGYLA
ncbi:MAG TPA: hypothetical protein VEF36_17175 [Roseiarcus sp.]|nr:hypothetical protein [Roseiarcus sp.]